MQYLPADPAVLQSERGRYGYSGGVETGREYHKIPRVSCGIFVWHGVRDSEPTPRPFALLRGELVKLRPAPCGRCRVELCLVAGSLNGGLTPNTVPTKNSKVLASGAKGQFYKNTVYFVRDMPYSCFCALF